MGGPHPTLPFSWGESTSLEAELSARQLAQLESALSYHALLNPGAVISARVAIGEVTQVPALTDRTTETGAAVEGLQVVAEISAQSTAVGTPTQTSVSRSFRVSHADATPATTQPPAPLSFPRRVYRALERHGPLALDAVREFIMRRRERAIMAPLPRFPSGQGDDALAEQVAAWGKVPHLAPAASAPAILFGLHWLQTGGAERWAVESIQLAKDAGFLPIVVTDQNSVHPWLTRPELDGCLVVTLTFSGHDHPLDVPFAHALLENYNLRGLVLHHSHYLYQMLPWITEHRSDLPVVDSLHIVEYLGGGYPGLSVRFDDFIGTHHVISPQLIEWLSEVQNVSRDKLALAPLTTLTAADCQPLKPRSTERPFTVSFVGRLSRQKRPDVFLGLVHRLRKGNRPFRAILHGDGEMRGIVAGLIEQHNLSGVIEQRFEDTPVADTLNESDVLLITSINEGITLTTFEANAAGVPVISTDVGSQHTIVQGRALLPRPARPFIRRAAALIAELINDEGLREKIWEDQRAQLTDFAALPPAHEFMKELFASWQA